MIRQTQPWLTVNQIPQPASSSVNMPPPDYDISTFEDNQMNDTGLVSTSQPNLPQPLPTSVATRPPQNTSRNRGQYKRQFSTTPMLNRTPSLPGDQTFVINPLFGHAEGNTLERSMSVQYARVNRDRASGAGPSGAGTVVNPIYNHQYVPDQDTSHHYARSSRGPRMVSGYSGADHHQYGHMDYHPPSYNDAIVMEKEELKRMFDNNSYTSYR